jgi:predicted nucleotidyltransferase
MTERRSKSFDTSRWEAALEAEARRREEQRRFILCQIREKLPQFFQGKRVGAVYVTGSVLRPGDFYPFSDVDIAVEGLQENYFRLLVQLEDLLERQVDLIELETSRFADSIRESGIRIL